MKSRGCFLCMTGILLMISLCGCSLAVPDAGMDGEGDRLIGAFITDDYLDLFDIDQYVNDHASELLHNQEIDVERAPKYEGRLYATVKKGKGVNSREWEISFEGVDGLNMLQPVWKDENGEECHDSVCSDGVSEVHLSVDMNDQGEETNLTGTIYMLPGQEDHDIAYHVNPVYQTSDGKIYAVSGSGFSTSGESEEGEVYSTTLYEERKETENGKYKTEKSSVTVRYGVMHKPVQITIYQMDEDHQILKQDTFTPGEVPDELTPESKTSYILIETQKEDLSGKTMISRDIHTPGPEEENTIETYYALNNGIIAKKTTTLK